VATSFPEQSPSLPSVRPTVPGFTSHTGAAPHHGLTDYAAQPGHLPLGLTGYDNIQAGLRKHKRSHHREWQEPVNDRQRVGTVLTAPRVELYLRLRRRYLTLQPVASIRPIAVPVPAWAGGVGAARACRGRVRHLDKRLVARCWLTEAAPCRFRLVIRRGVRISQLKVHSTIHWPARQYHEARGVVGPHGDLQRLGVLITNVVDTRVLRNGEDLRCSGAV
jgi:hypothetical protein